MTNIKEPLKQLDEIRTMMEKSSRFISLSGLSGIAAGIIALAGAGVAWLKNDAGQRFLISDAVIVLILAVVSALFFTRRRAGKNFRELWDYTARRLVINLMIPLVSGGLFCLILLYHHLFYLVPPATLIFYGLALLNAGKYTLPEIRVLGLGEIATGLIAALFAEYNILFWALGFGLLHIVYGLIMYNRYEKIKS